LTNLKYSTGNLPGVSSWCTVRMIFCLVGRANGRFFSVGITFLPFQCMQTTPLTWQPKSEPYCTLSNHRAHICTTHTKSFVWYIRTSNEYL